MALKAREWTELDRETMRLLGEMRNTAEPRPSLRAIADNIGVTHPRVKALFDMTGGTPTLDEVCDLCDLFNVRPDALLAQAEQNIGRYD
ncbi:hypothetical protein [Bifidobacterium animalis]|uniref:hypothetical protein n=1 Tax=Bifidobacterium animalis TaxID=28025 RepID=UPI001C3E9630|nr:hypothetical protein [Bifidobacterium animalis]MCR1995705.1 hypothetical protein [Bifidobacterium animalis subsp. animalis]